MAQCSCTPGSVENGWMEKQGPECREAELEQWRRACAIPYDHIADEMRRKGYGTFGSHQTD